MTTGTSTGTTVSPSTVLQEVQIGPGRGWPAYPAEPVDITPSSTGPLEILPTANRKGLAGAQSP